MKDLNVLMNAQTYRNKAEQRDQWHPKYGEAHSKKGDRKERQNFHNKLARVRWIGCEVVMSKDELQRTMKNAFEESRS